MMSPSLDDLLQAFLRLTAPVSPEPTLPPAAAPAPGASPAVPTAAPAAPAAPPAPASASTPVPPSASAPAAAPAGPVPVPAPAPAAPPAPCRLVDRPTRGFHLDASVESGQVLEAARILDRAGFGLDAVTGVDWMAQGQMEVVYDFFHPASTLRVVVRTRVPRECPELPTISEVFAGANWHERETHDFFGIRFLGHPDLTPFLLPEDADFHPLRKDFAGVT